MSEEHVIKTYRIYSLRTLGLWLLYAVVGPALAVMLLTGGGDMDHDTRPSPTRDRTKVLAGASGLMFLLAGLGMLLQLDPEATTFWPTLLIRTGVPIGVVLSAWALVWIRRDLNRGGVKKPRHAPPIS